jgi:hypothetical protein
MCSFLTLFIGAVIAVKSPAGNPCPTLNSVAVPSSSAVAMEAVPPVAVPAIEPMPENEYEREYLKVWEFVQRNYIFSDKMASWREWRDRYRGRLQNEEQTRAAVELMLASLHDDFTYLKKLPVPPPEAAGAIVQWKKLSGNVGYIRIRAFNNDAVEARTLQALTELRNSKGYILDLRGNKGGYISLTSRVYSMFVDRAPFLRMVERNGTAEKVEELVVDADSIKSGFESHWDLQPRHKNLTARKPVVILVDRKTRSSGEMLAGALRDTRGAVLIGERTFGKGVAQDVVELPGAVAKVVTARVFLPSNECMHGSGLTPSHCLDCEAQPDSWLQAAAELI